MCDYSDYRPFIRHNKYLVGTKRYYTNKGFDVEDLKIIDAQDPLEAKRTYAIENELRRKHKVAYVVGEIKNGCLITPFNVIRDLYHSVNLVQLLNDYDKIK